MKPTAAEQWKLRGYFCLASTINWTWWSWQCAFSQSSLTKRGTFPCQKLASPSCWRLIKTPLCSFMCLPPEGAYYKTKSIQTLKKRNGHCVTGFLRLNWELRYRWTSLLPVSMAKNSQRPSEADGLHSYSYGFLFLFFFNFQLHFHRGGNKNSVKKNVATPKNFSLFTKVPQVETGINLTLPYQKTKFEAEFGNLCENDCQCTDPRISWAFVKIVWKIPNQHCFFGAYDYPTIKRLNSFPTLETSLRL